MALTPGAFARLVREKEGEARAAILPPYATTLDQPGAREIGIGNEWSRSLFDGDFYLSGDAASDTVPAVCSLVFVQSRDGNTGARDPTSLGGGETDKHLIYEGLSRVAADAVLAGADTIRGSRLVLSVWHPELVRLRDALGKPRHPAQMVATLRGVDLDGSLMFNVPELKVVLLTSAAGIQRMRDQMSARPWLSAIRVDGPHGLAAAFRALREAGIDRVSAIGGRTLAGALLGAGLVQDIYLTTANRAGGEPDTPMYRKALAARAVVRKHGTGAETGVVFEHLALR